MKRLFILSWLYCFLAVTTGFASTAAIDGTDLLQRCKPFFTDLSGSRTTELTDVEKANMGFCAGYLSGVTDTEAMWKGVEGKTSKSTHYCLPKDATNKQLLRVLKKWLDDNPDKLHWRADQIIHDALLHAFPCK